MNEYQIKIAIDIIKESTESTIKEKCNKKAQELFITYLESEEGKQWLDDTYTNILKENPLVENVKSI